MRVEHGTASACGALSSWAADPAAPSSSTEELTDLRRRKMRIKPSPAQKVQVLPEQEPQQWVLLRAKSRTGEGGDLLLLCACLGAGRQREK